MDFKFVERLKKNFLKGYVYSFFLIFVWGDWIGFGVKYFVGVVSDFVNLFCDVFIIKYFIVLLIRVDNK